MKKEWPIAWESFWERLAAAIKQTGVQFMAGDFNMSLTEVPKQLRSRGIDCDCVAWYSWKLKTAVAGMKEHQLGFDSCGIFHIGGHAEVVPSWGFKQIGILTAVPGDQADLDVYEGANVPGQPWNCYRSKDKHAAAVGKHLHARLSDLLTLSTTTEELERIQHRGGKY